MGDELFDANSVRVGVFDPGKGEWKEVGEPVNLTLDEPGDDDLQKSLLALSGSMSLRLTMPWYKMNEWYKILTGRLRFTVRTLNRHKSWRGRWHRNGKGRS